MKLIILVITIIVVAILQGCSLDDILRVGESGSNSYSTVKNANSLGKLANTREIKANTSDRFIKDLGELIANQPKDKQAEFIKQSIEAKVELANRNFVTGAAATTAFWFVVAIFLIMAKFLFDRFKPLAKKTTNEF